MIIRYQRLVLTVQVGVNNREWEWPAVLLPAVARCTTHHIAALGVEDDQWTGYKDNRKSFLQPKAFTQYSIVLSQDIACEHLDNIIGDISTAELK